MKRTSIQTLVAFAVSLLLVPLSALHGADKVYINGDVVTMDDRRDAVNRQTRGGSTLGPEQRISVMDALRAITSDAARQNFEEQDKGSIEVGKLADFVILDHNPLTTPVMEIRKIGISETIIGGRRVSQSK